LNEQKATEIIENNNNVLNLNPIKEKCTKQNDSAKNSQISYALFTPSCDVSFVHPDLELFSNTSDFQPRKFIEIRRQLERFRLSIYHLPSTTYSRP